MVSKSNYITGQLKLLIAVLMLFIVITSAVFGLGLYRDKSKSQSLSEQVLRIKSIANIIHELQIERGISSGYLGSQGEKFKQELTLQQLKVDGMLNGLGNKNKKYILSDKDRKSLDKIREEINTFSIITVDAFDLFTELITHMRADYLSIIVTVDNFSLKNDFQAYTNLMDMKEALGQLRGSLNAAFAQGFIDDRLFVHLVHAKGEYDFSAKRFEILVKPEVQKKYKKIMLYGDYKWLTDTIDYVIVHHKEKLNIHPNKWFDAATNIINSLHELEYNYFEIFDTKLNEEISKSHFLLILSIFLFIVISTVTFWFVYKISKNIEKNLKILKEYKSAVDRSSIVSKTDKEGIITYVNDEFCSISGYTREELIGRNHNIITPLDVSKKSFKNMWETILDKRAWSGIMKNKKKDGSFYWVDATINPILDNNSKIVEFIAIRSDITELVLLHEEIENTQKDIIIRIGEVGETRSQETGYHVRRVAKYSEILAQKYGLSEQEIKYLVGASPMHDIGKVGIPDDILNKPGTLTKDEWDVMRTHCKIGHDIFKDSDKQLLQTASIIAYQHHEKYDGSGYPQGLKGENIHIYGRITAIADVFDALASERCYKKAWDNEQIFSFLTDQSGKHFDPVLIDIFFKHLEEFLAVQEACSEK